MCRIAGLVDFKNPVSLTRQRVEEMCRLLEHGGPDDGGTYASADGNVVLGNRRLSLLDLSSEGHMPMSYADRYHITYNGEIYNFPDLKNELLSLGHRFSSQTDTEVILAAFSQWGSMSFSRLKGMFAFALYDTVENSLYLVRDGAGIKPLYYGITDSGLGFASEVRALSSISLFQEENCNWPVYLMAYGHLPEPVTTCSGIKPLPKGFFMKYDCSKQSIHYQSFSHYSYSSQLCQREEALSLSRDMLDGAVKRHLLSDAPIGVFLSGGLDSGIISMLASRYQQKMLNTLSIYFEEPEYSEKKYQDLMIARLQCRHHQLLLRREEFETSLPDILNAMDLPSCDGINTWFISGYAAQNGLKAVLSGLGGDELYGGYPSFSRISKAIALQQLPDLVKTLGKGSQSKKISRLSYLKMKGVKGLYLFLRGHFTPNDIARYLGAYEKNIWEILEDTPVLMDPECEDERNEAGWMEFHLYMQNQLLRDSDVMGMNRGIEIRVPFLDDDNIRLANRIDAQIKYEGRFPKQFLIDSFRDDIPESIWRRPKMGFSFPFEKWLRESVWVDEVMSAGNPRSMQLYKRFRQGKLHWSLLMSLLIMNHRSAQ